MATPEELQAASDAEWARLASEGAVGLRAREGTHTILGFGSLLSLKSALSTFDTVLGFRVGLLRGWRRQFAHASPFFVDMGVANPETGEWGSLSVTEDTDGTAPPMVVAVFEIPDADLPGFYRREFEYRWTSAPVEPYLFGDAARRAVGALPEGARAMDGLMCVAFGSDEEYVRERFDGDRARFEAMYKPHGIHRVWHGGEGVLPCRVYLRHCVLSARAWGADGVGANFEDSTFLADHRTTIREHLARNPTLMDELPPPSLHERYNGP